MGRQENRKKQRYMKKKLSEHQFSKLMSDSNRQLVNEEVERRTEVFKTLFSECLYESFNRNGIPTMKANMIMDDIVVLMAKKVQEKKGELRSE